MDEKDEDEYQAASYPGARTLGKAERDKRRALTRWKAVNNIVETDDGALHVATVSGGLLAQHIAEMHNRTLGDGQDPPPMPRSALPYPGNEQALHRPWLAEPTSQTAGPDRQDGEHEILTVGDKSNLHVGYIQSGRIARYLVTAHNDRLRVMKDWVADPGPVSRSLRDVPAFLSTSVPPLAGPAAEREKALADATQDVVDNVPGAYACRDYLRGLPGSASPAALHAARRAYLAGYRQRSEEIGQTVNNMRESRADDTVAYQAGETTRPLRSEADPLEAFAGRRAGWEAPLPPGLRDWLLAGGRRSGYLSEISRLVEGEVQARVTDHAVREPARIVIDGNPQAMANVLRMAGYEVTEPGARQALQAKPAVELARSGDNGVRLIIDGVEQVRLNDGDTGGSGVTLAARALCEAFGVELSDPWNP